MAVPRMQMDKQIRQRQALLDSAGEGILGINLDGNCTFVNQTAANIFGFTSEEMLGNSMHELVHHHYPDGRFFPYEECPIVRVLHDKEEIHHHIDTMFRRDGSPLVVEMSAQRLLVDSRVVGATVTFHEVSFLRHQHGALQAAYELAEKQSAKLDAVLEGMPHGIYIATCDAKLRLNRQARAMSGESFPAGFGTLDRALAGESATETIRTADRWIRSVAEPIYLRGEIFGGVVVNTDVTELKQQDDALRKLEKLAAVGQLASSIAHEINNPLESITNLLYLIRESGSMEEVQQYAKIAQDELSRVTEITLQTLRFHRQNSKPGELDLAKMLRALMALYAGRMLVRHIATEMKLVEVPRVIALEGEIRQVVNNLVRNALDAMNAGGRLVIRLHPQQDWHTGLQGVRLTVADTGEGIMPEIAARLFEPFQTTKELTGTGLGLWVSKGIVEKHGGRIRNKTRRGVNHGTVFTVWLPVDGGISSTALAN